MSLFDELKNKIHKSCNSNFHFDKLSWETRVWMKALFRLLDEKFKEIEDRLGDK